MNPASGTKRRRTMPDLSKFFECPVCFKYILPPIYQCHAKHLICLSCKPNLNRCSNCRMGPSGNNRNMSLEKAANSICFPCKYSSQGCIFSILPTNKPDHEGACEFRPYTCPHPSSVVCEWEGTLDQVVPHLMKNHKAIKMVSGDEINVVAECVTKPGDFAWVTIQSCLDHHFMMVLQKHDRENGHHFFAIVNLIGNRKDAEKFDYKLEMNRKSRKLTWEATARSIREGVPTTFVNLECLKFWSNTAQFFAENDNLSIKVIIKKRDSTSTDSK